MNILDIKKKIFQKSFREFKDFFEEKKKAICDEKLKIESIRRGKVFEVYSALRLIGNDVWYNIAEYWTGLEGYDEKGIDFIYLEDSTLTILNCKSGKQNYSVKDIEEIFKGLQCIFEGGETKNTTLTKFIKKIELSKLKDINLYYCCELGDRESAKKNILLQNGIKLIQSYKKPREFSSVFNSINVKLKNFEDIYSIDELITLNIPYDEKYFFEDGSDRGFIARVKCSDIKNSIIEYGDKIFQKNIRGKLASCINQDIKKTLENNSNEFFLLNNGITIIGSEINPMKDGTLSIKNAQIINGQQTSRVITETKNIKDDAYILCRFFEVDNKKIKKITQTTNSQNSTNERDFVANDDLQIAIQEYFHEKGIFYGRKNKEINKYVHKKKIHNKEFAQSCLALILEKPSEARVPSSKKFFTNDKNKKGIQIGFYDTIFSQNIEDMCKAFEIYDQSYKKIKEGISGEGIDLSSEGWLHIASIWYRKNYKTYEEAFAIFEKFFKKENFEQLMKKGEKPLNKKDTDEKLILFLKTFKK